MASLMQSELFVPVREFSDPEGTRWKIWATYPTVGGIYSHGFEQGWLTFEAGTQRFRLAPIPARWENADEAKMRLMLKAAKLATKPSGQAESSDAALT